MASQCGAYSTKFLQWHPSVGQIQLSFSSGIPVWAVSTKFFQWCSSVPCQYSLGGPVVSQCTLGQPVAFQWHSSVHWTSPCTLAQGKGIGTPCFYYFVKGKSRAKIWEITNVIVLIWSNIFQVVWLNTIFINHNNMMLIQNKYIIYTLYVHDIYQF